MREFAHIGEMVAHLSTIAVAQELSVAKAFIKCVEKIEKTAKDEIGHYQPEVLPFAAWDPLEERTLQHHHSMGVGDTPLMVTGELYASISHQISGQDAVIGSDSDIMVYQELGTPTIPPRAVLGPAAIRNKDYISKKLGHAVAEGLLYGSGTTLTSLE